MSGPVLGVVGGSGGIGASTFAAVLAAVCGDAVLLDLDAVGGGLDVLLGIEGVAGARWSGLRVDGGWLDPVLLADGLPNWGSVSVLAADVPAPSAAAVEQVIGAAAQLGPVVLDVGRGSSAQRDAALHRCALVVLLAAAEVRGLIAARAVIASLPGVPIGLVVRRGSVRPRHGAELTGVPLIGVLPARGAARDRPPDARRPSRAAARVARGVLDGLNP